MSSKDGSLQPDSFEKVKGFLHKIIFYKKIGTAINVISIK